MDTFSKIEYVDAFYISEDTLENIDLYPHTLYGKIIQENDSCILVSYITKIVPGKGEIGDYKKGLLLTKASLISNYKDFNAQLFKNIHAEDIVNVQWDDIVYFEETPQLVQTKMYTEGKIVLLKENFLVIKDPLTIRTSPPPITNHPAYTPFYYVIPLSFITNIQTQ